MKILCIGPAHPLRGGIANFNTALCRSFLQNGHDASIVSFSLQYPRILFPGTTQYEAAAPPEDIRIRPLINSINPFSWIRTARAIRAENPDLVVVQHWIPFIALSMGFIIRRIRKKLQVPVIAITHNVIPHEQQPGWKTLSGYLIRACDGYIALSRSVLADLDMFTRNPARKFVPHPIYDIFGDAVDRKVAASELGLDPSGRYLLFFGVVRKYKGLDLLIRAFAGIRDKHPGLKLIVAGEFYTPKDEYLDLVRELEMEERIILRDEFIPSTDVRYYFSLADLVSQPYRTATQSGVTQIAYHFGVPMLVTAVGGLPEIVPDGRVGYVTAVDEGAVGEAIDDFFSRDRADEFRKNIQTEKKKFSWEAMTTAILDLASGIRKS